MANESIAAKRFSGLLLSLAGVVLVGLYVFRAEFAESFVESISSNPNALRRTVQDKELPETPRLMLRPSMNDIEFVKVSGLKAGPATRAGNSVSFTLENYGDNNHFPSLKIILLDRHGRPLRELVYSSADYQHPDRFEQHEVQLIVQLRPGESGFTVKPFYGDAK